MTSNRSSLVQDTRLRNRIFGRQANHHSLQEIFWDAIRRAYRDQPHHANAQWPKPQKQQPDNYQASDWAKNKSSCTIQTLLSYPQNSPHPPLPPKANQEPFPVRAQSQPCNHVSPERTPPAQRSLLPGTAALHQVRPPRLPMEPIQRGGDQGSVVREAAAPHAAKLALAVVVSPAAAEDDDGRAGQALPVARGADRPGAVEP